MIGFGWDDLSAGSDKYGQEYDFYETLKKQFKTDHQISYDYTQDKEAFYRRACSRDEQFDFVTIDLMSEAEKKPVGKDLAINLRTFISQEGRDPHLPIFLLSATPEEFTIEEALRYNISLIPKQLQHPTLTVQPIIMRLRESGRFGRPEHVLILGRHSRKSLAGDPLTLDRLNELKDIVKEAGSEPIEIRPEDRRQPGATIVTQLEERTLEAGSVIVLLTRDEQLQCRNSESIFLSRPNVYFELGMATGVRGGIRKLIVVKEKGAYLPSDSNWITPFEFSGDLSECRNRIIEALQSKRTARLGED